MEKALNTIGHLLVGLVAMFLLAMVCEGGFAVRHDLTPAAEAAPLSTGVAVAHQ